MSTQELTTIVVDALENLKGIDITILDVSDKTTVTDNMVICTGTSVRHVKSLGNEVLIKVKEAGYEPLGSEGEAQGDWLLIDLGDVVAHVMTAQTREFYALEKLWSVSAHSSADSLEVGFSQRLGKLRQR